LGAEANGGAEVVAREAKAEVEGLAGTAAQVIAGTTTMTIESVASSIEKIIYDLKSIMCC